MRIYFYKYLILTILFLVVLFLLFRSGFLYQYFVPGIKINNQFFLFGDWIAIISAAKCKLLGIDVFLQNPCDILGRKHVYGDILLFIPYFESLEIFYFLYFPIFLVIIFIFVVLRIIHPNNKLGYMLIFLAILNPSTLLLIERLNLDLFIFLIVVLLSYSRLSFLNYILVCLSTLMKFYPIILILNFFIERKRQLINSIILSLSFLVIIFIAFYINYESLVKIYQNKVQITSTIFYNFSLNSFAQILNIFFKFNYYQVFLTSIVIFCSIIFILFVKFKNNPLYQISNELSFEEKLFIFGSNIVVLTFISFSNVYYREVFLICLIPFFLKLANSNKKNFIIFLLYFLIFRYVLLIFTTYSIIWSQNLYLLLLKTFTDFLLVSIVATFAILFNLKIIKNLTFKKN